jgi:dolichol-phosphate mannosyltransferase
MLELSIIVPTFNERENVALLFEHVNRALNGQNNWEIVFVDDDSPDGTAAAVRELAVMDRRVRCVQRIGRRGLSTAVIEGMLASSSPYLAVIDADLQHDETLLPQMLSVLKSDNLDIVIGSRYIEGGAIGDWDKKRAAISGFATRLARLVVSADLADPMSGFFMLRRSAFDAAVHNLSGQGFKILIDLFASTPQPYKFRELPYVFGKRLHGESKLDTLVAWEYLTLLLDKLFGKVIPVRFIMFGAVGSLGVAVHFLALSASLMAVPFTWAQTIATVVAMTSNFALNNVLTYRDRRLKGWKLLSGLLSFYAICGIGAAANIGVSSAIFEHNYSWWFSGLAGVIVGVVWNYVVSSVITWRQK